MPRKAFALCLATLLALVAACSPASAGPPPVNLTVFAAASLTEAFTELGKNFQAEHADVTLTFNFAGSDQLAEQINQGAPADVFASANTQQMETAVGGSRIDAAAPRTFVRNRLVLVLPAGNPGGVATPRDLSRPGLRLVLAAEAVPVGQYSLDFLDKAAQDAEYGPAYKAGVLKNVVSYEENVKAVLTKVVLGEADAGIVYTSDVTGAAADQVDRLDIPDALNTVATYPIAALNDSPNAEAAQAFVDFVLSPVGQGVLAKYGFVPAVVS
jgi:molybdate transport system substrate-binding protein